MGPLDIGVVLDQWTKIIYYREGAQPLSLSTWLSMGPSRAHAPHPRPEAQVRERVLEMRAASEQTTSRDDMAGARNSDPLPARTCHPAQHCHSAAHGRDLMSPFSISFA